MLGLFFEYMKNVGRLISLVVLFCLIITIQGVNSECWAATYYVDATNGKDTNDGVSLSTAWKTIAKVNTSRFNPGDQVLFRRGQTWREPLVVPSSGSEGSPITFGAYGDSGNAKPVFMASNSKNTTGDWTNSITTVTYNISQTSDDKQTVPAWSVIGDEGFSGKRSEGPALRSGFRFQNVAIPQNATIVSAYIKFYGSNQAPAWGNTESIDPVNVRIKGQASDTTATFSTYADFAGRSETAAYVDWRNVPVFTNMAQFSSPDISLIVHEIVSREGWSSGNSMVIFLNDNGSTVGSLRDYKDYSESSSYPVSITITYSDFSANIWSTPISPNRDVGSILADNTVLTGKKSVSDELVSQGDFYYDSSAGYLYLYSTSNPATYYNGSIETWYKGTVASGGNIIYVANKDYININNIDVKYGGGHGIQTINVTGVTIENNTVSYVGGSYLSGTERYGNGIEIWDAASNITIQNNIISQTFDEGLTTQYAKKVTQNNIIFQDNIVDKCGRGISSSSFGNPGATISNIYWQRNTITDSGLGWATPEISNGEGKGAQLNITDYGAFISNTFFTGNVIRKTAEGNDPIGQGILVIGGSWVIASNWVENTHNGSIRIYFNATGIVNCNVVVNSNNKQALFVTGNSKELKILNNTFVKTTSLNHRIVELDASGYPSSNVEFKNNIIADISGFNNQCLLALYDSGSDVKLANNLYYNSIGTLLLDWKGSSYTSKSTWEGASGESGSVWQDPLFVNPSANNFNLLPTSPGIDAGKNVGLNQDYSGNSNCGTPDIGAYEYQPALTPPRALRIVILNPTEKNTDVSL
jgi:hypothetical protein